MPDYLHFAFEKDPNCIAYSRECPHCGGTVIWFRPPFRKKSPMKELCYGGGFSCPINVERKQKQERLDIRDTKKAYLKNKKDLWNMSNMNDRDMLKRKLYEFSPNNEETINALKTANELLEKALNNEEIHAVFTGKTGTGKTHLAIAVASEYLERSSFDKEALVVNWESMIRNMTSDRDDELRTAYDLYRLAKKVDFLVLDDLGVSKNSGAYTGSAFQREKLIALLESRKQKITIITTNLDGKILSGVYGDAVISRIVSDRKKFISIKFKDTEDYRQAKF